MNKLSYKIRCGEEDLTVTYFEDELRHTVRDPVGQALDMISNVHCHSSHEIFFLCSGEMELVLVGENKRIKNSVVVVPPSVEHYSVIDSEKVFVAYISFEKGSELAERLCEVTVFDISEDEKMYVEKLIRVGRAAPEDSFHIISLLFSEMSRRLNARAPHGNRPCESRVEYAFALGEYLEKHYTENISLSDVAEYLHLCEKQVSRIIKNEYKCSFCDFVNQKRLSVALMMLQHTDMTVARIAKRVGFENDSYFHKKFKEKYGKTPSEYRKIK